MLLQRYWKNYEEKYTVHMKITAVTYTTFEIQELYITMYIWIKPLCIPSHAPSLEHISIPVHCPLVTEHLHTPFSLSQ